MTKRATMATHDAKDRLALPGGYWLEKQDDNGWWIGRGDLNLALKIGPNVPVGKGGSIDSEIEQFAAAMNARDEGPVTSLSSRSGITAAPARAPVRVSIWATRQRLEGRGELPLRHVGGACACRLLAREMG